MARRNQLSGGECQGLTEQVRYGQPAGVGNHADLSILMVGDFRRHEQFAFVIHQQPPEVGMQFKVREERSETGSITIWFEMLDSDGSVLSKVEIDPHQAEQLQAKMSPPLRCIKGGKGEGTDS